MVILNDACRRLMGNGYWTMGDGQGWRHPYHLRARSVSLVLAVVTQMQINSV